MAHIESLYKTLSDITLDKLGFSFDDPTFTFFDSLNNEINLKAGSDKEAYFIESQDVDWSAIQNGINVYINARIKNCNCLTNSSDDSVAYTNSKLAIALTWVALESRDQGLAMKIPLSNDDSLQNLSFKIKFPKGRFYGNIVFNFSLVLDNPGNLTHLDSISGINNTRGIKLGNLGTFKLRLNGEGSTFPVFFKDDPDGELWKLSIDEIDDGEADMFDQTVKLLINRKHPDYIYLDRLSNKYCARLEKEIMAEAISEFLIYLQDYLNEDFSKIQSTDYAEGTVLYVAKYMLSKIDQPRSSKDILDKVRAEFTKGR